METCQCEGILFFYPESDRQGVGIHPQRTGDGYNGMLRVENQSTADYELMVQEGSALVAGAYDPQGFPLRGWGNPDSVLRAI